MAAYARSVRCLRIASSFTLPFAASIVFAQTLQAESPPNDVEIEVVPADWRSRSVLSGERHHDQTLHAWGNNANKLISSQGEYAKKAQKVDLLEGEPLRDLGLHETYAAAVLANGDVLQWGLGFSEDDPSPQKTLKGKNIVKLALTSDKIYALSKSGKVYVFAVSSKDQQKYPSLTKEAWYAFWKTNPGVSVLDLKPQGSSSEKFSDISAGRSHLIALSKGGKVYSHPVDLRANADGQLGQRAVNTSDGPLMLHPVGFEPDASEAAKQTKKAGLAYSKAYPKAWLGDTSPEPQPDPVEDVTEAVVIYNKSPEERDIHFCQELYPINSLKELKISQIATGNRHTLLRTDEGRVLGFGANNYGQLGLGSALSFSIIPTPSEISLSKNQAQCISIAAGGDLTYFTTSKDRGKTVELLACGHGQFGGIGNGQWSHQGYPARVKTLSGLIEWNESSNQNEPIAIYNISVGQNHAIATLDNGSDRRYGRDVFTFGHNAYWQLGLNKRSNQAIPQHLPALARDAQPDVAEKSYRIESRMPHNRLQLQPATKHKGLVVEETAVAGFDTSAVYWKILNP